MTTVNDIIESLRNESMEWYLSDSGPVLANKDQKRYIHLGWWIVSNRTFKVKPNIIGRLRLRFAVWKWRRQSKT